MTSDGHRVEVAANVRNAKESREAAAAGALDLALGGPRKYPGLVVDEKWLGSGRARAELADIHRALHLFTVACLMEAGLVMGLLWLEA